LPVNPVKNSPLPRKDFLFRGSRGNYPKIKLTKKSLLLILLFLLIGCFFLFTSYVGFSPELLPPIKNFVSEFEKNTGRKISFTKLRTNFFTNLNLDNLNIYYALLPTERIFFKSKTASFRFNIFSLFIHFREPLKSIKKLTFKEGEILFIPHLLMPRPLERGAGYSFSQLSLKKKSLLSTFLIPEIYFKDFLLKTEDVTGKLPGLNIAKINGSFFFTGKKIFFNFWGNNEWKVKGRIYPEGESLFFQMEGKNFPFTFSERFTGYSKIKLFQGKINFIVEIRGDDWQNPEQWDYQGTIFFEKTKIEFVNLPFGLNSGLKPLNLNEISAEINFNKKKCLFNITEAKLGDSSLKLKGEVYPPYENPSFQGKMECASLEVITSNWKKVKLSNLSFQINYSSQVINITSIKFDLNEGKVNGNFRLDFRQGLTLVQGKSKIKIDNFLINKNLPKLDKFELIITYQNGKLQIEGKDRKKIYKLKVNAKREKEEIDIEELTFVFVPPDKKYLSRDLKFQGKLISHEDKPLFKGKLFTDLGLLSVLLNYPEKKLKGKISTFFEFDGSKEVPTLSGEVKINQGYWKKLFWDEIEASFTYRKEDFNFNKCFIKQKKGKLSLQLNWQASISDLNSHIEAKNFYWQNILLNGILDFAGKYKENILEGKFLIFPLQIKKINFRKIEGKIYYAKKNITLLSSIDDFAKVESEINLSPGEEEIKGKLEIQTIDWEKLGKIINRGEKKKSASGGLQGKFNAIFSLTGKLSQPKLNGEFQFQEGNWQGIKFSMQGNCFYNFLSPLILETSLLIQEPFSGETKSKIGIKNPLSILKGDYLRLEGIIESEKLFLSKNFTLENTKIKIRNKKERILLTSFQTKFKESEIYLLNGSYIEKNKFLFLTEIRNLRLANFILFGKLNFAGEIKTVQEPFLQAQIKTDNFWINQHNFQRTKFYLQYRNKNLTFLSKEKELQNLSGEVDFTQYPKIYLKNLNLSQAGKKILTFQGMFEQDNFTLSLKSKKFPLPVLLELINQKIPCQGEVNFKLFAKGSLQNPTVHGEFNLNNSEIYQLTFTTFTTVFRLEKDTFFLKNLKISVPEKYSLSGFGEFPLVRKKRAKPQPLFLTFVLEEGELSFLKNIIPQIIESKGKVNGKLIIKGNSDFPQLEGSLLVSDGVMEIKDVLKKISEFNAHLKFSGQNVFLRSLSAKIGQGKIEANGKIELTFSSPDKFPYFKIKDYAFYLQSSTDKGISVVLEDLIIPHSTIFKRLIYAPSQGEAKVSFNLAKREDKPILDGIIELSNTHFTYPAKEKKTNVTWNEIFNFFDLNLEIRTKDNVWYENELVNTNINGFLKLTGKGKKLKVNGKIEVIRGNLSYLNRNFEIKKAIFEVIDNVCYLEGVTETKTTVLDPETKQTSPDVVVMVIDRGKIGEIQPKFYSKNYPLLTQEKALNYVFANVDISELTPEGKIVLLRREILRWIDTSLTTPLVKNILTYAGLVDTVRMERETPLETTEGTPTAPGDQQPVSTDLRSAGTDWRDLVKGTKVTFEKQILQNILLGYSVKLDTLVNRLDLKHEFELAYRFRWKGDVLLRATYELEKGQTTSGSATPERKIYLEPRWRFGWEE